MTTIERDLPLPVSGSNNWFLFDLVMKRPWIPLALGFALVLGVGVFATRTFSASEEYNAEVREALVVIGSADEVTMGVLEMNSAQRGYIIGRKPEFLERYNEASQELETELTLLRPKLQTMNVPASLKKEIEQTIAFRKTGFREINRLLEAGDFTLAGQYSSEARLFTDDVRIAMRKLKRLATIQLTKQQRAAAEAGDRAYLLTVAGLFIACLLILGSIALLSRRSAELEKANADVRGLASTLEQRVAQRTADLEEANEEIQRFAYIVSHDLRSPLVNLMGFTAELQDTQEVMADFANAPENSVPEEIRTAILSDMPEAMGFIRTATGRMDRLIKAILQISREGRRTLSKEKIDLEALFSDLVDSLSIQTDAADAQITIGDLPDLDGDRVALEQVFGNLLDNAVKYLRPGVPGQISVTGETRGKRAVIRVKDNGRGIAEHDRRRVFELFRRSGEQDRPGEGIGLAHVQALVRRLGGQIHVESQLGDGSCFTVNLPLNMAGRE